jgi:transposase
MMGTKARLFTPLPSVTLEELIPADHFYRHLDRALSLSFVRDLVLDCYTTDKGRPSIDPVVFFKLQLVMFFEGIRSERQLVRLAADRLSVRWYLGYNLDEPLPDHSSLTRIRARYGLTVFRHFFEAIVEQCQQAGLVWGKELYIDATQVQADAALDSLTARFAVEARESRKAVEAYLAALFPAEDAQCAQEASEVAEVPAANATWQAELAPPLPLLASEFTLAPPARPPIPLPVDLPNDLRTELATANAARHDWIAQVDCAGGAPAAGGAWLLPTHRRLLHQRHRSRCHCDAPQERWDPSGLPDPLCGRRRQTPHHPAGAGHSR